MLVFHCKMPNLFSRSDVPDCNNRFFPPSTVQSTLKDHPEREVKNSALNHLRSTQWPIQDTADESSIPTNSASSSACPYNGETSAVSKKVQNSSEFLSSHLHSSPTRAERARPALAFFLQQSIAKPSYSELIPTAEQSSHSCGVRTDDDISEAIYQNLPPPLPPKKNAPTSLQGLEHESLMDLKPTEVSLSRTNPSNPVRQVANTTSKTSEASLFADEDRLKAPFQENEFSKTDSPSSLSVNDLWAVSSKPMNKGACSFGSNPSSLDSNANETVSLTTYFSVDACMTDTYRLKYHQRPKWHFADAGVLKKEASLSPAGLQLNTSCHRTSESRYPITEHIHNPSIGNVHCNR